MGYKTRSMKKIQQKGGFPMKQVLVKTIALVATGSMFVAGCTTRPTTTSNSSSSIPSAASAAYQIESTTYDANRDTVTVHVIPNQSGVSQRELIDISNSEGIINYATSKYPTKPVKHVTLIADQPATTSDLAARATRSHTSTRSLTVPKTVSTPTNKSSPVTSGGTSPSSIPLPPPGARIDQSITPDAGLNASVSAKTQAVLSVATSKMGTPYIWGHNEDRGQYGFDCSNFTEYVYHHALGYLITTFSTMQYTSVGVPVSLSQIQPGDLIAFEQGAHVGIYAGNNQVIQCGGGLQKVGYISIAKGTYWGNHISAIKRMY
jgi:cell wall-associated NlpC family hydrolase